MEYQVNVQPVAPQLTAVIRLRARQDELSTVIPQACGEVWEFARAAGLPCPGRHLALYFDDVINIEVGAEVFQPFTGNDRVVCSSTPARPPRRPILGRTTASGMPTTPFASGAPTTATNWPGRAGRCTATGRMTPPSSARMSFIS
jgi:hypothetical protein